MFNKNDYKGIEVRLIEYNNRGKRIKESLFVSVTRAVQFGYASGHDFLVCEPDGEEPTHFWSGTIRDKERKDYWDWPALARQKDLQRQIGT